MTDRRRGPGQQDRPSEEDNPFAPPPEGQPDRPWRPRYPGNGDTNGDGEPRGEGGQDEPSSRWGSQWSRRQPGRQSGGFGDPPPAPEGRDGKRNGNGTGNGGLGGRQRWDPSDPGQRHARYAVLSGMWGVFSGLLGWEWLALLLGALALYWGISGLRGGPKDSGGRDSARQNRLVAQLEGRAPEPPPAPAPGPPGAGPGPGPGGMPPKNDRPQLAAAVSGIVLASAALLIVATTYTVQLVYQDYFHCVEDALTMPSREACEQHLPTQLRPFLTENN
jgi:hypothetical protein